MSDRWKPYRTPYPSLIGDYMRLGSKPPLGTIPKTIPPPPFTIPKLPEPKIPWREHIPSVPPPIVPKHTLPKPKAPMPQPDRYPMPIIRRPNPPPVIWI